MNAMTIPGVLLFTLHDGKPNPITREAAAKAITNAYKELTLTPEERQARRERSEKIKQEVRERLRKQGLIK
jgi:hypothetical protein